MLLQVVLSVGLCSLKLQSQRLHLNFKSASGRSLDCAVFATWAYRIVMLLQNHLYLLPYLQNSSACSLEQLLSEHALCAQLAIQVSVTMNQSNSAVGGTLCVTTEWWQHIRTGGCIRTQNTYIQEYFILSSKLVK